MGAFTGLYDDEVVVRIPPASPSRRDYQLRSVSPSPSRPQSPWRPRDEVSPHGSQEIDTHRMYDSYPPAARSSYYSGPLSSAPQGSSSFYSGPLPSAPQGVDRSYYSGPLPTIKPPSQGGFSTTGSYGESVDFEFATWAKGYHGQHDSNDGLDNDEPSSFYLSNPAESRARANAEFAERAGRVPLRNCVSGELGISEVIVKQKSEAARGYKSGEIMGLNICADGIYSSSPPLATEAPERGPTAAWDALMKDAKDMKDDTVKSDGSNCDSEMVAIPFKWEEVSCQPRDSVSKKPNSRSSSKPNSRASSVSQKPNSRTSSVSQKPNSRTSSVSQKPNSRTSSTAAAPLPKPNSRSSSVSQKPAQRAPVATAPTKKPTWKTSTTPEPKSSVKKSLKSEFSFGGSHKLAEAQAFEKPESVREEEPQARPARFGGIVAPPALKPLRTKTTKQEVDTAPKSPFSVPFKWEEEPGKSKFETEEKPEEATLQLPPRLAVKPRASTPPTRASSKTMQAQLGWVSEPESTSKYVESVPHLHHSQQGSHPQQQSRQGSHPQQQSRQGSHPQQQSRQGSHPQQQSRQGSSIPSSKKFFDKDCFRRCRRLLVNLF